MGTIFIIVCLAGIAYALAAGVDELKRIANSLEKIASKEKIEEKRIEKK